MSLDMVASGAELRVDPVHPFVRRPYELYAGITDLVFVFGGLAATRPAGSRGIPRAENESTDVGHLVDGIRGMRTLDGHNLIVYDYNPTLIYEFFPFHRVLSNLASNFHPLGHLILYGFSAGGYIVLELTRRISNQSPPRNRFLTVLPSLRDDAPSGLIGFVRVDYLVTIDPAVEVGRTDVINRRVAPSVRRNLDYYQTNPNFVGSRGHPTVAIDSRATYIRSTNLTQRLEATGREPHTSIDNDTHRTVLRKIQEVLLNPIYVVEPQPAPTSHTRSDSAQTYTVARGDSLWRIAERFYGNGRLWARIYDANRDKITNPNFIHPGLELTIPPR